MEGEKKAVFKTEISIPFAHFGITVAAQFNSNAIQFQGIPSESDS